MIPATPQSTLVDAIPQLDGNIPAAQFAGTSPWLIVGSVAGVLAVLAGLLLWWYWRRKHRLLPAAPSPLAVCSAHLDELEEALPTMRECSIRLSFIIREFLAGQAQDTSLYETHEEFTQRIDSLTTLPAACRLETQTLLNTLAEYKYTGESEDNTTLERALIGQTRNLFHRIVDEQQKEAELQKLRSAKAH